MRSVTFVLLIVGWISWSRPARAEKTFQFKNRFQVTGTLVEIASLKDGFGAAAANQSPIRPIWLIDDGLRRHFVHGKGMVAGQPIDRPNLEQELEIWQDVPRGGKGIKGLGSIVAVSPFNEFGRRRLRMLTPSGGITVIQGITELNSRYAKLSALTSPAGQPTLLWDSRISTTQLSTETLNRIFSRRFDQTNVDERLAIVRFFINTKRYGAAQEALRGVIEDFPDQKRQEQTLRSLTGSRVTQLFEEAERRREVGQPLLARKIFENLPLRGIDRATRFRVEDAQRNQADSDAQIQQIVANLKELVEQLPGGAPETLLRMTQEIESGLSEATIGRLSDFARLGDSETLAAENRIALAIAGWLLGSGSGEQNLTVATSLIEVRDLVAQYLSEDQLVRRQAILEQLKTLEGAIPQYVDRMLPLMSPVLPWPEASEDPSQPGLFVINTGQLEYAVQLPPEYDPLRSYPCVISVHPGGSSPIDEINWWCGQYDEITQTRLGEAARNGFIVIAPRWNRATQRTYQYTPAEHERVLRSLRHAMRRCSIDSDRVFIAGRGEGGTCAWDVALAHPDIWAGMVAISATPEKTVHHYEPNSLYLPLYMVAGQYDDRRVDGGLVDDYMSYRHDAMLVLYRGRGREFFPEELPRIFEWMSLSSHKRRPIPRKIETKMIRKGDEFFWWLELLTLKPDATVDPILWDQAKRKRARIVEGSINEGNLIRFQGPASKFRISLRPQPGLDLNQDISVQAAGGRKTRHVFDGELATLLEDVRRRADRKRGFWMEITIP